MREHSAEYLLCRFAKLANQSSLHPNDWKRFYQFVAYAHQRRVGWDTYDIQERLLGLGFTKEKTEMLAGAYWHGRCALHMNKPRLILESYDDWMRRGGLALT